jgi:hypothetical protein
MDFLFRAHWVFKKHNGAINTPNKREKAAQPNQRGRKLCDHALVIKGSSKKRKSRDDKGNNRKISNPLHISNALCILVAGKFSVDNQTVDCYATVPVTANWQIAAATLSPVVFSDTPPGVKPSID